MRLDPTRWTSRLGGFLGVLLLVAGAAELVGQRENPVALLVFWLPALWGGSVLILYGVFRATRPRVAIALTVIGCAAAALATMWTVVVPLLMAALVWLVVIRAQREASVA